MEIEEQAKAMGWVPKEEFRGDPERWTDAETFVERGKGYIGIAKENIERLTNKVGSLERQLQESVSAFQEFREFATKSEERAFERAQKEHKAEIKTLTARLKEAAKNEDWTAFDQIETDIAQLEKPVKPEKKQVPQNVAYSQDEMNAWISKNAWFNQDEEMTAYAIAMEPLIVRQGKRGESVFEEIDKKLRSRFPEKYENPNNKKPNSVEGGDPTATTETKTNGKFSFNDIKDAEERRAARASYNKFKKQFGKDKNGNEYSEQEYLRVYFGGGR